VILRIEYQHMTCEILFMKKVHTQKPTMLKKLGIIHIDCKK